MQFHLQSWRMGAIVYMRNRPRRAQGTDDRIDNSLQYQYHRVKSKQPHTDPENFRRIVRTIPALNFKTEKSDFSDTCSDAMNRSAAANAPWGSCALYGEIGPPKCLRQRKGASAWRQQLVAAVTATAAKRDNSH